MTILRQLSRTLGNRRVTVLPNLLSAELSVALVEKEFLP